MRAAALLLGGLSCLAWFGCFPDPDGDPISLACRSCKQPTRSNPNGGVEGEDDGGVPVPIEVEDPPPAPKKCSSSTPFGPPVLVPGIDPARHASSPHLTPDERVIYFTSHDPDVSAQVYRASRISRTEPFGPAEPVPGINSTSNDNDPTISADGLVLVFHTGREGNQNVWWAKRADPAGDFGAPVPVPGIASPEYDGQGFFHVAGDELWFVSTRNGTFDLFRAKRNGDGFDEPVPVTELNTPQDEFLPFLSEDGLTIYFSSTREGGKGGQDLYIATRTDPNAPFGAPVPIVELNTEVSEQAGSISPDNCRIYFSRHVGPGGQQVFMAERPLP